MFTTNTKHTAMNDHQKFAAKLNAALDERGWSQSELARRAGLRRDAVSTYCRAAAMPSKVFLDKIAKALGGSAAELLDGSLPPGSVVPPAVAPRSKPAAAPKPKPAVVRSSPAGIELRQEAAGELRLCIDRVVTVEQAMKILTILS
jgi:transcriptional regulator with XRE-family HTH domain